jgi:hypothetical protein
MQKTKISKSQAEVLGLQFQEEVVRTLGVPAWSRLRKTIGVKSEKFKNEVRELATQHGLTAFLEWDDAHEDFYISEPPLEPEGVVERLVPLAKTNQAALNLIGIVLDARIKREFLK